MSHFRSSADSQFYAAIHRILEAERVQDGAERRTGHRHAYRYLQLIAPIIGGRFPTQAEFMHVQCDDLSCGGMAYLSTEMAPCDEFVVALGARPFLYLRARILRHNQLLQDGKLVYRIACRFVERIDDSSILAEPACDVA